MSFDLLRKEKTVDILLTLLKGAKGIREIQESIGGSNSTLIQRIKELLLEECLIDDHLTGEEFGKIPRNKRLIRLTPKGKKIVDSLIESGFVKQSCLEKDRQKWILCSLDILANVIGNTRMTKLLFLLRNELGARTGNFFRFKPHFYGPYSNQVADDLISIEKLGLLYKRAIRFKKRDCGDERVVYEYSLTENGKSVSQELFKTLQPDEIKAIQRLKIYNQMTLDDLLKYVYREYPSFTTKSRILKKTLGESDVE